MESLTGSRGGDIANNAVDELLLAENQKLSSAREASEFLDSDYDENDVYQFDEMSLEETRENLEWRKRVFEYERNNLNGIENRNDVTRIHNN